MPRCPAHFDIRWHRLLSRLAVGALALCLIVIPTTLTNAQSCGHYVRTRLDREREQQFANRLLGFQDAADEFLAEAAREGLAGIYRLPVVLRSETEQVPTGESDKPCDGPGCRSTQWPPAANVAILIPTGSRTVPLAILTFATPDPVPRASTIIPAENVAAVAISYPLFRPPQ